MDNVKYKINIENISEMKNSEKKGLRNVCEKFPFRANDYYLSLIDWNDPNDPIKKLIIPDIQELSGHGTTDPSNEKKYTCLPGLEHKYQFTAIVLVSNICGGLCRYCFRKRLFMGENAEVEHDIKQALGYIREHTELNNILLTGGDPLMLSTARLENILSSLREIEHIKIIRLGSKIPAFNPHRILNDPYLLKVLKKFSTPDKKIYVMTHFDHPRELTEEAKKAIHLLMKSGVVLMNQTPIIRGINDSPEVLGELFNILSFCGITPYYIFQCRPVIGNYHFAVPVEEAYEIHQKAKMITSGLGKCSRFVMSHSSGKIQVQLLTKDKIFFRFHRSADPCGKERTLIYKRNPDAYWYDDYKELVDNHTFKNPFIKTNDDSE